MTVQHWSRLFPGGEDECCERNCGKLNLGSKIPKTSQHPSLWCGYWLWIPRLLWFPFHSCALGSTVRNVEIFTHKVCGESMLCPPPSREKKGRFTGAVVPLSPFNLTGNFTTCHFSLCLRHLNILVILLPLSYCPGGFRWGGGGVDKNRLNCTHNNFRSTKCNNRVKYKSAK